MCPGPKEPEQAPPLPEFVPLPVYPEFMPWEDDVILAEEKPLPAAISPTTDSPGYIPKSDPEEDSEEDDDEDPEEDPADYPTDRDDEEEEEPFEDEANDEDKDEDDKEEEDHPAPADSVPPLPVHRTTARISILAQAPVPFLSEEEVERFLAIPTPPPSPLTPLSSPLPQIPSLPLLVSPPLPVSFPPPPGKFQSLLIVGNFSSFMIRPKGRVTIDSQSLPLYPSPNHKLILTRAPMAMTRAAAPSTYTLAPP
ncbi:hypothetical protein Tco_0769992 [Tanacetum coccineum]|uniref:Uncharacterized protein n=1 Tax=Tanacetum coccineum TaxID=301880 RepID=A0ABQ4ZCU3_9ASTR